MVKRAIGIMSGTSMDGIDVVMASIEGFYTDTKIIPIASMNVPYNNKLQKKLFDIVTKKHVDLETFCSLNYELGEAFAAACLLLCEKNEISIDTIDFVASHGQTMFHIGSSNKNNTPSTLQLGEAAVIAKRLNTTVVYNFRAADIAAGGEGAPLVPYVDVALFSKLNKTVALHNLGGISNVTIVPKSKKLDDVIAFDTGPANMMIDCATRYFYNKAYDLNGNYAKKGSVIDTLLDKLMQHPFLNQIPPKSTGREMFGDDVTLHYIKSYEKDYSANDIIATLTRFSVNSIVQAYKRFVLNSHKLDSIIFSGGGTKNSMLIESIQKALPSINIQNTNDYGLDPDDKEALAFIVLANETLAKRTSNVPTATGSKNYAVLGQIQYP